MKKDLFIFAGEVSGDLHGEKLIRALLKKEPNLKIYGVGGPKMREAGLHCLLPMENFQVMGFIDVFLALPKLIKQFYAIRKNILKEDPKAVLFIDYPGFNLRMADHLRKKGYSGKLCHYIAPSVWAWGKKRIPLMAKNLDLLLSILPFEKKCFSQTSLKTCYVGHPLVKRLDEHPYQELKLAEDKRLIALFPGSRTKELMRNLPLHLKVARRLLAEHSDLAFAISVAHPKFLKLIEKIIEKEKFSSNEIILISPERNYDLMKAASFAIAKSGTVTLELALHGVPTVVTYGISKLDIFIAKNILKIILPFYCLVNIIYGEEVFPELIGPNLDENSLYTAMNRFLSDASSQELCKEKCHNIKEMLSTKDASDASAKELLELI